MSGCFSFKRVRQRHRPFRLSSSVAQGVHIHASCSKHRRPGLRRVRAQHALQKSAGRGNDLVNLMLTAEWVLRLLLRTTVLQKLRGTGRLH